jgi:hypothetical protein
MPVSDCSMGAVADEAAALFAGWDQRGISFLLIEGSICLFIARKWFDSATCGA